MSSSALTRLSAAELEGEVGAALPAKEVLSVPLLDLNIDIDLALALAAPIDLAVAANANVALPIDAAASANVLSVASTAAAQTTQGVMLDQIISGAAIAEGNQAAEIDQSDTDGIGGEAGAEIPPGTEAGAATAAVVTPAAEAPTAEVLDPVQDTVESALAAGLVNVDVNVALDADLAAPIAGAVAANANVAAPIDASVAANIGSIGSQSVAVADQTAIINQQLVDVTAQATANQTAGIDQADTGP